MNINNIVDLYKKQKINAKDAFDLINKNDLLPEAFMQLLVELSESRGAFDSLCPEKKDKTLSE